MSGTERPFTQEAQDLFAHNQYLQKAVRAAQEEHAGLLTEQAAQIEILEVLRQAASATTAGGTTEREGSTGGLVDAHLAERDVQREALVRCEQGIAEETASMDHQLTRARETVSKLNRKLQMYQNAQLELERQRSADRSIVELMAAAARCEQQQAWAVAQHRELLALSNDTALTAHQELWVGMSSSWNRELLSSNQLQHTDCPASLEPVKVVLERLLRAKKQAALRIAHAQVALKALSPAS
eukprot:TRINITY_DN16628_c0_g1_i1.p1 TRINITY_DN16628_c0_g1~~TRINITY_DN16628_c0_g1_i1.p1  ORF type:complete len:241 (-),score=84.36 TRINITY_DN16628_c0_g1_i1:165-887(-)